MSVLNPFGTPKSTLDGEWSSWTGLNGLGVLIDGRKN